ncbi:MAG: uroporphyrinogen-III C-methyltransferase [Okeania sp. SIO3B5]|uniref:uroporphyrinogen-III C-methyltransferase n=1 Tax=Okeania sp. SIO3B5 TaxID=2607811 RepID=UPI001400C8C5|nr:uroporphyrinogen-III C-methyltransferase [Okeania sp. SIO3B5]NEO54151.1 uroporphyrinogen-III C-methyltransferase [Okeania sp. SIO3B5]
MTKLLRKVYIVGAGPGSKEYLTVKAHSLITQAEVLIYDALVDDSILKLAPENCLKIEMGKRGGKPSMSQSEINSLLVEKCGLGKQVIRLKGGDPFIFGRAASEIQALIEAGCEFEVVPGISSVLAAPLLANIPLTDAVMSRAFVVLTAHDIEALDWERISQIETLVILMGARNLDEIVRQLLRHKRTSQTPVAIIQNCATPEQQIWVGSLGDIVQKTYTEYLSPCVIIVGEVVRLRDYLKSPNNMVRENSVAKTEIAPLANKTVLVTRAAGQSSKFSDRLQKAGAKVIEMPALVITPPSSWHDLDVAINNIDSFDWLILTSTNGVDYFFERLAEKGKDSRALSGVKIAVVGKKTSGSLNARGLKADFIPPNFVADSLVVNFPENLSGKKVLFPRVETGGREVLVNELSSKGAEVIEVAAYESSCPENILPEALLALQNRQIDIMTFASSKTVRNFCYLTTENKDNLPQDWLENICIASIGPQTSQSCQSLLGRVDVEAQEYTLDGLTEAIIKWVGIQSQKSKVKS